MKLSVFIVTYKGFERLPQTLESLFESDTSAVDLEVTLLNNHTDFRLDEEYLQRVNVIHNQARPDWSNGHLSRNWNQALLHGFRNLDDPAVDAVVAVQDDTIFQPEWASRLIDLHEQYTLVQGGLGDQFVSYRPKSVKNIGLWDERFIFSYHADDYFRRAVLFNDKESTINDPGHDRLLNPIFDDHERSANYLVNANPREMDDNWEQSALSVSIGQKLIREKYGNATFDHLKNQSGRTPNMQTPVFYPYFERDVYDLEQRNYLWDQRWLQEEDDEAIQFKNEAVRLLERFLIEKTPRLATALKQIRDSRGVEYFRN